MYGLRKTLIHEVVGSNLLVVTLLVLPKGGRWSAHMKHECKKFIYLTDINLYCNTLHRVAKCVARVNPTSRQLFNKCWWAMLGSLSLPDWMPRLS